MADFQENLAEFEQRNTRIIGLSVDPLEDAQELIDKLGLTFDVAYGLEHMEFATKTGAFYEVRRSIIHATSFLLYGTGEVLAASYSTNPIGRYNAIDCQRVIDFENSRKK